MKLALSLAVAVNAATTIINDGDCEVDGCYGSFFTEPLVCAQVEEEFRNVYNAQGNYCVIDSLCGWSWHSGDYAVRYSCQGQEAEPIDFDEWYSYGNDCEYAAYCREEAGEYYDECMDTFCNYGYDEPIDYGYDEYCTEYYEYCYEECDDYGMCAEVCSEECAYYGYGDDYIDYYDGYGYDAEAEAVDDYYDGYGDEAEAEAVDDYDVRYERTVEEQIALDEAVEVEQLTVDYAYACQADLASDATDDEIAAAADYIAYSQTVLDAATAAAAAPAPRDYVGLSRNIHFDQKRRQARFQ